MVPRRRHFFLLFLAAAFLSGAVKSQDELTRLCNAQERCRDCILASPMCNWCADQNFNGTARCYAIGTINACSPENTQNPRGEEGGREGEDFGGGSLNQISPRRINVTVRPGEGLDFPISVQPANNFPVDLYLLMDLSFSMRDDLENLQRLGALLAERIIDISSNFTIGFGSFVDKRLAPYINLDPARLVDPCLDGCVSPYSYRHVISLTNSTQLFNMSVQRQVISGNQDSPEGGFDGFLQSIVCREMIGWRDLSRKLLLYISDAGFHFAGDGKLGGVIKPHDGECRMPNVRPSPTDPPVEYEDWDILDYPSIGQIAEKLRENEVIPIFAVEGGVTDIYLRLVEELNRDWVAFNGTLAADSSNVVDLVEDLYNEISQRIIFQPEQVPGVAIDFIPNGCPGEVVNGECTGVEIGMTANFTVSVSLQECTPELQNGPRVIPIRIVGFGSFEIVLNAICSCPCEEDSMPNSNACSGNGTFECGICVCEEGRFGERCDCDGTQRLPCPTDDEGNDCSGNGQCNQCGVCQCDLSPTNINVPRYIGSICECDNPEISCKETLATPTRCNNRGTCTCNNGCDCDDFQLFGTTRSYTGSFCECSPESCVDPDTPDRICNNNGVCNCDRCVCDEGQLTFGDFCSTTPPRLIELCPGAIPCVQCILDLVAQLNADYTVDEFFMEELIISLELSGDLPVGSTFSPLPGEVLGVTLPMGECSAFNCTQFVIINGTEAQVHVIQGEGGILELEPAVRCPPISRDGCTYRYYVTEESDFPIHVEFQASCPQSSSSVEPWVIALAIIVPLLILGLLALALLKLLLILLDAIEVRKFQHELAKTKYSKGQNPLYRSAQKEYPNPLYGK